MAIQEEAHAKYNSSYEPEYRTGNGSITVGKDTMCGLYCYHSGGGSLMEIELERDVTIPTSMISDVHYAYEPSRNGDYTVMNCYGMMPNTYKETLINITPHDEQEALALEDEARKAPFDKAMLQESLMQRIDDYSNSDAERKYSVGYGLVQNILKTIDKNELKKQLELYRQRFGDLNSQSQQNFQPAENQSQQPLQKFFSADDAKKN